MTWAVSGLNELPNTWKFVADNITGDLSDNTTLTGGYDKVVRFEIIVDRGLGEFYGRYDFGSGFMETNRHSISQTQLDNFSGIVIRHDYRNPTAYLGAEYDNLVLESTPSQTVPEPSSPLSLLAIGIGGVALTFKRKLKSTKSPEKQTEKIS